VNEGYLQFWGDRPLPARITVGCSALALGSCVEIDVIAKK
jgi:enamine deaminase RidA (YjgF/YER057c/UK114 family)